MKTNYYIHKKLNISNIGYGFFTKNGGCSNDNYASLYCKHNTDVDQNIVNKNINIAKKNLGLNKSKLKFLSQIHSNQVIIIDKNKALAFRAILDKATDFYRYNHSLGKCKMEYEII